MSTEHLRQFVRARRKRLGWSQADLHTHGGPSMGWIGSLESGRADGPVRGTTLQRLAKCLGLPGETPGTLNNFLALAKSGVLTEDTVLAVAHGWVDAAQAMQRAMHHGEGITEDMPQNDTPNRRGRLARVLAELRLDLPHRDAELAEALLTRLYLGD